jgi:hypothetical protein
VKATGEQVATLEFNVSSSQSCFFSVFNEEQHAHPTRFVCAKILKIQKIQKKKYVKIQM